MLEVVNADAEQLLRGVMNASSVAEDISSTVKTLDVIQSNVKAALSHISIIVDRYVFWVHFVLILLDILGALVCID